MRVLIGGVGQLFQGDLDLGRRAAERLTAEGVDHGGIVEELHYGAVAVAQRLEELRPEALVLVGAAPRGRPAGTVERRRVGGTRRRAREVQRSIAEAVTGYVTVDLVVEVAAGLGVLPARTVLVEMEPVRTGPSVDLSPEGEAGLEAALELVRAEVRRLPLLQVADEVRRSHDALSGAPAVLHELLDELLGLDEQGRWGRTFALRDRFRRSLAEGGAGDGVPAHAWALWWSLVEELDRVQRLESVG